MNHFGFQDTILLCDVYAHIVCYLKLLKDFSNTKGLGSLDNYFSNAINLANIANDLDILANVFQMPIILIFLANDVSYSNNLVSLSNAFSNASDLVSFIFLPAFLLFHFDV